MGGWVNIQDLKDEGIISEDGIYQMFSNLRAVLQGATLEKDGHRLIQSDGSKKYRISIHPDLVTYNKSKLLDHPDHRIGGIAAKLKVL